MSITADVAVLTGAGVSEHELSDWQATARHVAADLAATALDATAPTSSPSPRSPSSDPWPARLRHARQFGGAGGSLSQALRLSRIIAAADGSIGQLLLLYHYSNGVWTSILGTGEQARADSRGVGEQGWFQGSVASNPRDPDVTATGVGDRVRIDRDTDVRHRCGRGRPS